MRSALLYYLSFVSTTSSSNTTGDSGAFVGDLLVFAGLVIALAVYLLQRATAAEQVRQSALAILQSAKNGIDKWGGRHFAADYTKDEAAERTKLDYDQIMAHGYYQNFVVPTEPLVVVLQQSDVGSHIKTPTIEAINVALWHMNQFNQIVQQQTDFNARHSADVMGDEISDSRRVAIATAARRISRDIHAVIIGDGSWYRELIAELERNLRGLESRGKCRVWELWTKPLTGY